MEIGPVKNLELHIAKCTSIAQFAAMRGEWRELVERSDAGLFSRWEWLYPWYRRVAPERSLLLLTARDDRGKLVGLMPLCIEARRVLGKTVRRVAFMGETEVGSECLDIIAHDADRERVSRAFAGWLLNHRTDWDMLDLSDIDSSSPTRAMLDAIFSAQGYRIEHRDCSVQPYERWEAAGRPIGDGVRYWLEAERELSQRM